MNQLSRHYCALKLLCKAVSQSLVKKEGLISLIKSSLLFQEKATSLSHAMPSCPSIVGPLSLYSGML